MSTNKIQDPDSKIIASGDHDGRKVHITVLYVTPDVHMALDSLKNVKLRAQYVLPLWPHATVHIYLSAYGRHNSIFLRDFTKYYDLIKERMTIIPVYEVHECPNCPQQDCLIST